MKSRRLLALSILAIVFGCEGHQTPTAPGVVKSVPFDSTAVLSDGAHGGNPDFFFLPPLVPPPFRNPNFELGKFNNTLQASLKIEICELAPELSGLPKTTTACVGSAIKTFAPGTVQLVNLPLQQWGWWTAYNLPPDGFYYALWDTRGPPVLSPDKYYRIKVFISGSTVPIGYADVDPMANLREWRYALTGEVIQLVNGWLLPIPFRVENGALCSGAISCTSETVSNTNPGGSKTVQVIGNDGVPVAGARFPDHWLPEGGPQSVVVTISSVNTGPDNPNPDRSETIPCHATLDLQQFRSCFKFTTTPTLPVQDVLTGRQFTVNSGVTVAVCYILLGSEDPRAKFGELYASNPPSEPPHALIDASDIGILGATDRNCGTSRYGLRSSNPLVQLASAGWDNIKAGLDRVFGVKTAYAIDVGLGGLIDGFSNVGVAVKGNIAPSTRLIQKLAYGEIRTSVVRITGTHIHDPNYDGTRPIEGIGGIPVIFTVSEGGGGLGSSFAPGTATVDTVMTSLTDIFGFTGPGWAPVNWTVPNTRGIHTLTVQSPAFGAPMTFTDTVRGARLMLSMQAGATYQIPALLPAVTDWFSSGPSVVVSPTGAITANSGGESLSGANAATLTSSILEVEAHTALVNSLAFDIWPRHTTAVWLPVTDAASYLIVREHAEGCNTPTQVCRWVSDNGAGTVTTDVTFTFDFVGAQPGRWRVTPLNSAGGPMTDPSPWVYFGYNI